MSRLGLLVGATLALESDSRLDKVNVLGDMFGQAVVVGTNMLLVGASMVVGVVLCLEDILELFNGAVEGDPSLTLGDEDGVLGDTGSNEPLLDDIGRLVGRLEELNNLFLGVVLAVAGRFGIRAAMEG